jgi:hypothetical protein
MFHIFFEKLGVCVGEGGEGNVEILNQLISGNEPEVGANRCG